MQVCEKMNNTIKFDFNLSEDSDQNDNRQFTSESFIMEAMPIIKTIYKVFYTNEEERSEL